jgi:hypothetical protein
MERRGLRRPIHPLLRVWLPVSSAAAFFLFCVIKLALPAPENLSADSRIYIDGKRYADIELIRTETLNALNRFSEDQPDLYASQAEALNLFCNHN